MSWMLERKNDEKQGGGVGGLIINATPASRAKCLRAFLDTMACAAPACLAFELIL
jgi:hypothetical protein